MSRQLLYEQMRHKESFLCVGLDTDINRLPSGIAKSADGIFEFNKQLIDKTHDLVVAYKPNLAFYEALGPMGMEAFQKTVAYIPDEIMVIADAKRGDIGNTASLYARAFFEHYDVDALTVAPYMGADSILPFLDYNDRWVILLGLTSNAGSQDFQHQVLEDGRKLYLEVIRKATEYGSPDQLMLVIGATQPEYFEAIRNIAPDHFWLVPGVGAQGGSLDKVAASGMNNMIGLIVNSSRGIIYASDGPDFADAARLNALELQQLMSKLIKERSDFLI